MTSVPLNTLLSSIPETAERLASYLSPTPLVPAPWFDSDHGVTTLLKCEHRQPTGSFKVRGALSAASRLPLDVLERGVVTCSSGNHGAAVSWALARLGGRATIFTYMNAAPTKLAAMRGMGAEVIQIEGDSATVEVYAAQAAAERGQIYISPYNHLDVVSGQGTTGFEIAQQTDHLDAVFVTIGGGGLVSGIAAWLKHRFPAIRVYGCLPENSAAMPELVAGRDQLAIPHLPTLSDGSAGTIETDSITIGLCADLVDDYVLVSELEIARELRRFIDHQHELIEGSAAVALAGLRRKVPELAGLRAAVVLCGANISANDLQHALEFSR